MKKMYETVVVDVEMMVPTWPSFYIFRSLSSSSGHDGRNSINASVDEIKNSI